jgi:hypothetical protein
MTELVAGTVTLDDNLLALHPVDSVLLVTRRKTMVRKVTIALASIAFVGAMSASVSADARMGGVGGGFGGGFHGAMMGGGFRGGMMSSAGFRSGFVGSHSFGFRPGFAPRFNRLAFARSHHFHHFHRFHHFPNRFFAFAAAPFAVGVGESCWSWQPTPWGWQRVWICGG